MLCLDSSPEMLSAAEADPGLSGRALVNFACQSIEEHFAPAAATSGPLYDLIFANASLQYCDDVPDLAARMLARVRPGGTLALQLPDTRQQPSHLLMHELANEFGPPADAIRVPTNTADPAAYAHALLGNHCASVRERRSNMEASSHALTALLCSHDVVAPYARAARHVVDYLRAAPDGSRPRVRVRAFAAHHRPRPIPSPSLAIAAPLSLSLISVLLRPSSQVRAPDELAPRAPHLWRRRLARR
jgi:hypothetical protein